MACKILLGFYFNSESDINSVLNLIGLLNFNGDKPDYLFVSSGLSGAQQEVLVSFVKEKAMEGKAVYRNEDDGRHTAWVKINHYVENIQLLLGLYKATSVLREYDTFVFVKKKENLLTTGVLELLVDRDKNAICYLSEQNKKDAGPHLFVLKKNMLDLYLPVDKNIFKENILLLITAIFKAFEVGHILIDKLEYVEDRSYKEFPSVEFISTVENAEKEVMRQWIKYDELQKIINGQKRSLQSQNVEQFNKLIQEKNQFFNEFSKIEGTSNQLCDALNGYFDRIDNREIYDPVRVSKIFEAYLDEKSKKLNMMFESMRKQSETIAKSEQELNRTISQMR